MPPSAVYIIGTPNGATTRRLYEKVLQHESRICLNHPTTESVKAAHRKGVETIVIAVEADLSMREFPHMMKIAQQLGIRFLPVGDRSIWEQIIPISMPELAEWGIQSPEDDWELSLLPPPPLIRSVELINGVNVARDVPNLAQREPLVDLLEEEPLTMFISKTAVERSHSGFFFIFLILGILGLMAALAYVGTNLLNIPTGQPEPNSAAQEQSPVEPEKKAATETPPPSESDISQQTETTENANTDENINSDTKEENPDTDSSSSRKTETESHSETNTADPGNVEQNEAAAPTADSPGKQTDSQQSTTDNPTSSEPGNRSSAGCLSMKDLTPNLANPGKKEVSHNQKNKRDKQSRKPKTASNASHDSAPKEKTDNSERQFTCKVTGNKAGASKGSKTYKAMQACGCPDCQKWIKRADAR